MNQPIGEANRKQHCVDVLLYAAELIQLLFACEQVWKCVAADISNNKRSQFLLLAELEHEAGVSKSLAFHQRLTRLTAQFTHVRLFLWYWANEF